MCIITNPAGSAPPYFTYNTETNSLLRELDETDPKITERLDYIFGENIGIWQAAPSIVPQGGSIQDSKEAHCSMPTDWVYEQRENQTIEKIDISDHYPLIFSYKPQG